MKTENIMIRIDPELKRTAQARASENYEKLSAYITRLIVEDIKKGRNTTMTIKDVINEHKGEYVDCEVYEYTDRRRVIHTDFIRSIDDPDMNAEVIDWELMDEDDYDKSVLANSSVSADFSEWYDDKEAKVLVIMIEN